MKPLFSCIILFTHLLQLFGQEVKNDSLRGKVNYSIEIPEVQELVFVILAITNHGLKDSVMINHNSNYYQKTLAYFGKFKSEKIVKKINKKAASIYNQLRMDASNYMFDNNSKLVKHNEYHNLSWGKKDYLQPYLTDLEEFCKKTQFRHFYTLHRSFYDSLIATLNIQAPINKQHIWLEKNFPKKYTNFRVVFSPLSYGKHSTNVQLRDVIIFVSSPTENSKLSKSLLEARDSRMLFTEIDHHYVNPVSDLHLTSINQAFNNRKTWASGKFSNSYKNQYAVFNEYMTWSVFILYAMDTYQSDDFLTTKNSIENFMEEYRGFVNFSAFNEKMIELYKNKGDKRLISDLFPEILSWCEKQ